VFGILAGVANVYGTSLSTDQRTHQLYTQGLSKSMLVGVLFMSAATLPLHEWIPLPPGIAMNTYNETSVWLRILPVILFFVIWVGLPALYRLRQSKQTLGGNDD
jgi:hypothetical protein